LEKRIQLCLDVKGDQFQHRLRAGPVFHLSRYVYINFQVIITITQFFIDNSLGPLARDSPCIGNSLGPLARDSPCILIVIDARYIHEERKRGWCLKHYILLDGTWNRWSFPST